MRVPDRRILNRVFVHAEALGFAPMRGEHPDAAWVEVRDPDGIWMRFAVPTRPWYSFVGLRCEDDGTEVLYGNPGSTSELRVAESA